ncbi:YitT family protein [Paraglaciecola sp. 2405UD69-4]|uniref:YitT family protein n=1 Tax=Paraglaciecola sp. 2405UD69-4 TaxID=3391836 RepID=UPI0039C8DA3A
MNFPTHRFYEDVIALFCAGVLVSFGLTLFGEHNLLTGGTAGVAIIVNQLSGLSFGLLFFLVNLPFYYIAWTRLSKRFTINTFISVAVISVMTEKMGDFIDISSVHPLFSSLVGGIMIGMGVLIMFRHKSSLGGLGILALYLQNRFNIRAGHFGLVVDATILFSSVLLFSIDLVLLSLLGAITFNLLVAVNHKPGRYQAYTSTEHIDKNSVPKAQVNASPPS